MLDPDITFLNHGSFGACTKPVYEDLLKWQLLMEREPVKFFEEDILIHLEKSRNVLGDYIGCSGDDLVFFANPTTALNAVARSLELSPEDEVLGSNHIYGGLDRTWQFICKKIGARLVRAPIPFPINSRDEFLNCFLDEVNRKTKVIFLSHITSMTALEFPVEEIVKFGKDNNILTIIDGAHVPGHIPLNIQSLDPDIYTGACHKWMCTPKGVSFLYVKKELQEKIHPLVVSWGWESENPGKSQFLDWHEWQGTRDMSAFLTIPAAVKFLTKNNWTKVGQQCRQLVVNTRYEFLTLLKIPPPCPDNWLGQMASIPLPVEDGDSFKNTLLKEYRIQVPVFQWEGNTYLRYSVQAYNSADDLKKLIAAIRELLN